VDPVPARLCANINDGIALAGGARIENLIAADEAERESITSGLPE